MTLNVRVSELAEQIRGVSYGKEDASSTPRPGYLPVLRAGNIQEEGLVFDDLVFVPAARIAERQKIRRNDVVIAASSGSIDVVGKAARAERDYEGAFGAFCKVLRPHDAVDPAYFAHFFRTRDYRQRVSALAAGININNLRNEDIDDLQIPIPSLSEQRRIADILDKADALRAKRRAALAKLAELKEAIFLEMFGGRERHAWIVVSVSDVAARRPGAIRTGPFGSQLLHSEFTDSGVAVLGIDNAVSNDFRWGQRRFISQRKYESLRRYTVNGGDVLITIMGTCGRCAVVPDDLPLAINTKHLCCVSLNQDLCLPMFLHSYFLMHPVAREYLSRRAKGAIMSGLNMEIISRMPLPLPPIDLQRRFVAAVGSIRGQDLAMRGSSSRIDALFASLQDRAFRGELKA